MHFLSYTADMLLRVLPTVRELENDSLGLQTLGVQVQSPVFLADFFTVFLVMLRCLSNALKNSEGDQGPQKYLPPPPTARCSHI